MEGITIELKRRVSGRSEERAMLNDLLCFFGFHRWMERDAIGVVHCEHCGDISVERTKIRRYELTPSKVIGCEHVICMREKEDWET